MRHLTLLLILLFLPGNPAAVAQTNGAAGRHNADTKRVVGRALTAEEIQAKGDKLAHEANSLSKAGRRDDAIRLLDEACHHYQQAAGMYYRASNKGKEVGALEALAKALRQKVFNLYELSFDESRPKGSYESQAVAYRRTFAAFPIFIQKLDYGLALVAISHEAYADALRLLENARDKGSANPESEALKTKSTGELALCHQHLGHHDTARRLIREAIQRAPNDSRLRQIQKQIDN